MSMIKKLNKGYGSYFSGMWTILQGPLSFSFQMLFERGSYSSLVNVLGFFSLLLTIPYTAMIGLPVGLIGLVLGALSTPFAYFIAGLIDLGSYCFSNNSNKEYVIHDFRDVKTTYESINNSLDSNAKPEASLDEIIATGLSAVVAHEEATYYYESMTKSKEARATAIIQNPILNAYKDDAAVTQEEIDNRNKARPLFIEAKGKFEQVIAELEGRNVFFLPSNTIRNAEAKLSDCENKLAKIGL